MTEAFLEHPVGMTVHEEDALTTIPRLLFEHQAGMSVHPEGTLRLGLHFEHRIGIDCLRGTRINYNHTFLEITYSRATN